MTQRVAEAPEFLDDVGHGVSGNAEFIKVCAQAFEFNFEFLFMVFQ
jgi:hypothetical protein